MTGLESTIDKTKDEIIRLLKQATKESFLGSSVSLGTLLSIEEAVEDCLNRFFIPYWPKIQVQVEAVTYSDGELSFPLRFRIEKYPHGYYSTQASFTVPLELDSYTDRWLFLDDYKEQCEQT